MRLRINMKVIKLSMKAIIITIKLCIRHAVVFEKVNAQLKKQVEDGERKLRSHHGT